MTFIALSGTGGEGCLAAPPSEKKGTLAKKLLFRRMAGFALLSLVAALPAAYAQEASKGDTQDQNIDAYVGLLRQDIQTQKVAITSQLMQLSPEQAATFWPIYADYAKGLASLGDMRVRAIKEYVATNGSISDQKATELANLRLDYEARIVALKRKYFEQLSKALTPKVAARFFQIENQLLDILDLQIASSLPVVQ